ncbi:MAG: histidine--tRNA ligase [Ginsengibacter sp.]
MKPSLPPGTRDFNAETIRKRQFILSTIKSVFELYGFEPLETPAMENLETLMGKYGDEGDKLIFQVLDSGEKFNKNFAKGISDEDFLTAFWNYVKDIAGSIQIETFNETLIPYISEWLSTDTWIQKKYLPNFKNEISEKALRYDLTIPFARYVSVNYGKLTMPFKRYQMQPVWRADRPQKGRYREFYQCDADVVGSTSLINEQELILLIDKVFTNLSNYFSDKDENRINIHINNRKVWAGIAELCGCSDKITDITVALDKFEKIGKDGVILELIQKGFKEEQIRIIFDCLFPDATFYTIYDDDYLNELNLTKDEKNLVVTLYGLNDKVLFATLTCLLWNFRKSNIEIGISGVKEIMKVIFPFCMMANDFNLHSSFINIDSTLARGLNYYTGTIIEVKSPLLVKMGSIGGGGRYDDLTGLFGLPNIPGVGISFGVDRIYDVMTELNIFPEEINKSTQVLFFNLGEKESAIAFKEMQTLRNDGISCELFYENVKMDKQFKYATKKNIPFAVIIGSEELEQKTCTVKNLLKGEQQTILLENLSSYFKL